MTLKKSFAITLLALIAAAPATPKHPTTGPSTSDRTLQISAAISLEKFRGVDRDVDLRNHIDGQKAGDVYFGQADTYDGNGDATETVPIVVTPKGKEWVALSLADERLANAEWQFVASGPAKDEVWGVLDDTLTARGKVILLAHSVDGCSTWNVHAIQKPFDAAEYDSFAMARNGRGRLTVYVHGGAKRTRRTGYYHIRTNDGGKTWGKAEQEPDALEPAEEVSPDEDPAPLQEVPMQRAQANQASRSATGRSS